MKIMLASEAMECCAKAMESSRLPVAAQVETRAFNDVRAIYQAAATIQANTGQAHTIPVPDWLAKVGGYG